MLEGLLAEAYAKSPRSNIVITFDAPIGTVLNYHVRAEWWTVEGAYENWISTRYTTIFTHQQVSAAASGLPLRLVSDDSVYEYEKAHLPEGAWPPTSWYTDAGWYSKNPLGNERSGPLP